MLRSDFHFDLPDDLIAQEPRPRGSSRMLLVDPSSEGLAHLRFDAFPTLLREGDLLVVNDTEVFPARIVSEPKGNMLRGVELLLTKRAAPLRWEALCKPARRVHPGDRLTFSPRLCCAIAEKRDDGTVTVQFDGGADETSFWQEIERVGRTPLPPYIRREEQREDDRSAYQTVYAKHRGAVAAPTAGLHFTPAILGAIADRGVSVARLTLHVGIGTFKPVTADRIADHVMEPEWFTIPAETAAAVERTRAAGGRVVAVGTTSVRSLESAADESGRVHPGDATTRLFITPGYQFHVVDALLTNFHLPESTLLMLVSAFAGTGLTRRAYAEAIREKYMFYSYGDCMFIPRRDA